MKTLITDSIVFHGGISPVIVPKCDYSRDNCDFGQGFYCTRFEPQAKDWAFRKIQNDIREPYYTVNQYKFRNDIQLATLEFDSPTAEWFDVVIRGRNKGYISADIIVGPVADSNIRELVDATTYKIEHLMSQCSTPAEYRKRKKDILEEAALKAVPGKYKTYEQAAFLTPNAIDQLDFMGARVYDRNHAFKFWYDKDGIQYRVIPGVAMTSSTYTNDDTRGR